MANHLATIPGLIAIIAHVHKEVSVNRSLCFAALVVVISVLSGCGNDHHPVSVSLSPSAAKSIDQGQTVTINATVANDSKNQGVTWSVSGGGTLTASTTISVTYNAPSSVTSNTVATVTATSVADTNKSASVQITVAPAPAVTTTSFADGNQGTAYSATINASGGTGPYSWSVSAGSLPAGLSLGSSTGNSVTITGTPTAQATSNFTIKVMDAAGLSATQALSITVGPPLPLAITTTSLANGAVGTAYSQTVQATGGIQPYAWTVSAASLPPGLALAGSTGLISGTPTGSGTFTFTVKVTDSATPAVSATKQLSITVTATPLSVTTTSLPAGTVNSAYSATLQATGGLQPYSWAVTAGSLPNGVTLNSSTGVISGPPTTAATSNFTVQVTDSETPAVMATANLSITINATGNNSKLSGPYAFVFHGWGPNGLVVAAGDFSADGNGNITNGLLDVNDPTGPSLNQAFTGGYSIASDNLGTVTLVQGPNTLVTLAIVVQANGDAKVIEFDDTTGTGTRGSGVFRKQDTSAFSTSKITGDYAEGLVGVDSAGKRLAVAGVFHADGAGNISNGLLDGDDNGALLTSATFSGTYAAANNGRGTATITITGQGTSNYSFYVVSATELLLMQIDSVSAGNSLQSGTILQQTGAGSFTNASLNGACVLQIGSLASSGTTPRADAGLVTPNGAGNFTFSFDENTGGTLSVQSGNGTYAVASNGRVPLSVTSGSAPVLYLVKQNEGFIVGTGSSVESGFFQKQSAGPFSTASFSGTYAAGGTMPVHPSVPNSVAEFVAASGNYTATLDNSNTGGLQQNQMLSGTYAVDSTGRITSTTTGQAGTTGIFYVVSPTKIVGFVTDSGAQQLIVEQ